MSDGDASMYAATEGEQSSDALIPVHLHARGRVTYMKLKIILASIAIGVVVGIIWGYLWSSSFDMSVMTGDNLIAPPLSFAIALTVSIAVSACIGTVVALIWAVWDWHKQKANTKTNA